MNKKIIFLLTVAPLFLKTNTKTINREVNAYLCEQTINSKKFYQYHSIDTTGEKTFIFKIDGQNVDMQEFNTQIAQAESAEIRETLNKDLEMKSKKAEIEHKIKCKSEIAEIKIISRKIDIDTKKLNSQPLMNFTTKEIKDLIANCAEQNMQAKTSLKDAEVIKDLNKLSKIKEELTHKQYAIRNADYQTLELALEQTEDVNLIKELSLNLPD